MAVGRELLDQLPHPIDSVGHSLFVKLDAQVSEVDNGDSIANSRVIHVHAHVGHVRTKGVFPLLKGYVNPACFAVEDGIVKHRKCEAGLHCS